MLALVVALKLEALAVVGRGGWKRGSLAGAQAFYIEKKPKPETVVAVAGVGKQHAEATAHALLARYAPDALVSLGFAGGLRPELRPGALVGLEQVYLVEAPGDSRTTPRLGPELKPDPALLERALDAARAVGLPCTLGVGLTSPQVVGSRDGKERLGRLTGALTVDMESYWLARVCEARRVPFLAIRAVLDPVEMSLPSWVDVTGSAAISWGTQLGFLVQPWRLPSVMILARATAGAGMSLARFAMALRDWGTLAPAPPRP